MLNGSPALVGIIGTDQVSLSGSAIATFATRNAGAAIPVNVTGLSLTGADAANYILSQPVLNANISTDTLTISGLSASNKIYDGTTAATLTGTPALVGIFANDQVSLSGTAIGTFVTRTAGSLKLVKVTGLSLAGADAANYTLIQPSLRANITPATLTISGLSANDKIYDSTTAAMLNGSPALVGIIGTDQVSLSGSAIATFSTRNAGAAIPVNVTGLSLTGADAANYILSQPVLNANISTDTLTISGLSASNKIYDGTTAATLTGTPALVGIFSNDQVSLSGTAIGTFVTRTAGSLKLVKVTGLILAGADAANYTLIQPSLRANITPATLTISGLSASSKIYDGTTAAALSGSPALVGIIGNDQVSLNGTATGTFAARTAGTSKPINVTGLSLTGADAINYSLTDPVISATISPATITLSGILASIKVYDGTTAATLSGTPTLVGVIGTDQVSLSGTATGIFATRTAGAAKPVNVTGLSLSGVDAGNYSLTQPSLSANITPAALTVAADNQNRPYGVSNPSLTFTYSGFVNGETAAVLSGQPSLLTTALASSPAGTYAITVSLGTLSAANYSFKFVNGTLTITPDAPLILGIAKNASSKIVLTWTSVSNVTYRVQYSSDLKNSIWSDLAPDITANSSTSSAQDNTAGLTPRFYRIFVVP
jgi:hypothetical protein